MPTLEVGLSAGNMYAPLEESLEKGGEFGFDYVEFLMDDELNHRAMSDRADEVTALAAEHGVDLLVHLPFHTLEQSAIGSSDEEVRAHSIDEMKGCIDVSRQLGAEKGVLHIETNGAPHLVDVGQRDTVVDELTDLDRYARDRGFEICVENLPERYPNLSELDYLASRTDVSLTVDTGHARVNGHESDETAEFVSEHVDRIAHFHLNDTRRPLDEHLPFRAGTIDFEAILAPVLNGWDGTLTFEIQTGDFDYIELSKQKLDKLLA